jgi:hypothetical protein
MSNLIILKKYKWYNYIVPFQSSRQFFDTLIISLFICLQIYVFSEISFFEIILIFSASWLFGILSCHMSLPADILIDSDDLKKDIKMVRELLIFQGYNNSKSNDAEVYIPLIFDKIPWRSKSNFMVWVENNIRLKIVSGSIKISGPVFMMKIIANKYVLSNQ